MSMHPLHSLGFEGVSSLAGLGFEPQQEELQPRHAEPAGRSASAAVHAVVRGMVMKGSRVRLADGTVARVRYADPKMRIVRVRTVDGRKITVRYKDLRPDVGP
jgi:hypothetical protein